MKNLWLISAQLVLLESKSTKFREGVCPLAFKVCEEKVCQMKMSKITYFGARAGLTLGAQ